MHPLPRHGRYDAVIAGARVAGAATALLLAREGLRVLVVDPLPRGRDTLSTHALMRGGVLQLHRWGLLEAVKAAGTPPIRVTTFDYPDGEIPVPIKEKDGVDALYAPRRTVLDPLLLEAAEAAGAEVVHGLRVEALVGEGEGRIRGVWLRGPQGAVRADAGLVVGADGVRSRMAELLRAPLTVEAAHTTASIYGYWRGLPDHEYRWYFREGAGAGIIPTNDGAACLFVSVHPAAFREARGRGLDDLFHREVRRVDPELAARLAPGARVGTLRGFAGRLGYLRRSVGPGWALVGDAGYFRDPLTAHGISDALRDAELLARAVVRGGEEALQEYEATRDAVARGLLEVTDRIASLDWEVEEVKALHHQLSREMNAGVELIRGWDAAPAGTRAGAAA